MGVLDLAFGFEDFVELGQRLLLVGAALLQQVIERADFLLQRALQAGDLFRRLQYLFVDRLLLRFIEAKVREIQQKAVAENRNQPGGPPEALAQKMRRLSEYMNEARHDGRDMSAVRPLVEELSPLMHQGKYSEAEPLIDRALKMLDEGEKK